MSLKNQIVLSFALILIIFAGCMTEKKILPEEIIRLDIPEPSGLCLDEKSNTLWVVSDENSFLYNIDFYGNLITKIEIEADDLEGICEISDSNLAVVCEKKRLIKVFDKSGSYLNSVRLNYKGDKNSGFEGITYNKFEKCYFILNEKNPGLLIKLNNSFNILFEKELDFAEDYSGITYDKYTDSLWILSDKDKSVFKLDLEGNVLLKRNFEIEQAEGIAVTDKYLFIVSDFEEILYKFDKNKSEFL